MALFVRVDNKMHPTPFTTGPWRTDAQHGGPPAALLGRAIEALMEDDETLGRIAVDLVRPVPLEPITVEATRITVSRRVTHFHASLRVGSEVVANANGLALRGAALPEPDWRPDESWPTVPPPEAVVKPPAFATGTGPVTYHQNAVEHRMTDGEFDGAGSATSWVRLLEPLVEGEETSGLCSLLAAADFGSGISFIFELDSGVGMVNADLSVAFTRPPVGEWTRLESVSRVNDRGTGLAITQLGDERGHVGIATQSLLGIAL